MSDEDKTKRAAEIDAAIKKADAEKEAAEKPGDGSVDKILAGITKLGEAIADLGDRVAALEGAEDEEGEGSEVAALRGKGREDEMLDKTLPNADGDDDGKPKQMTDGMNPRQRADADIEHRNQMAAAQSRADAVANLFGSAAPRPMDGETLLAYRRRLLTPYQNYSERFKSVRLDALSGEAFSAIEGAIYADAAVASNRPEVPAGVLLERKVKDSAGREHSVFFGPRTFVSLMSQRARRVGPDSPLFHARALGNQS